MLLLWVGCYCCCFGVFLGVGGWGGNRVVCCFVFFGGWGQGITEIDPTTHRTLTRHHFTELQKYEGRLCHAHTARALDSLLHTSTRFAAGRLLPRLKKIYLRLINTRASFAASA